MGDFEQKTQILLLDFFSVCDLCFPVCDLCFFFFFFSKKFVLTKKIKKKKKLFMFGIVICIFLFF